MKNNTRNVFKKVYLYSQESCSFLTYLINHHYLSRKATSEYFDYWFKLIK